MKFTRRHFASILVVGSILSLLMYVAVSLIQPSVADFGQLENIYGQPYVQLTQNGAKQVHVTEKLAHVDLHPNQNIFAKKLRLTVTFSPHEIPALFAGVRENPFWLSYHWQPLLTQKSSQDTLTRTIEIPLTDKLPDTNRSLDVMFLATRPENILPPSTPSDTTYWQLHRLEAKISPDVPSFAGIKNYIRSLLQRERPI